MHLPTLARCYTTNNIGPVFNHLLCMKGTFASGKTLYNKPGVSVHKNAHTVVILKKPVKSMIF
jgi:hypothetical protein